MTTDGEEGKTIQATQTAFDIIESIADRDRPTISEIATRVEYSRSTVHYHLKTLQRSGYVVRDEEGFHLGLRMARLGDIALRTHRLSGVVEQTADELARETDAVAHVAIEEGYKVVWLYRSMDEHGVDVPTSVGMETPVHATAYGQALLAFASNATVDELVGESGLRAVTERTLTERDELEDRLSTIRNLGFAYSAGECIEGYSSIAAPIVDDTGEVLGAIGISDVRDGIDNPYKQTKARRFSDELPGQVQKAARIAGDRVTDV